MDISQLHLLGTGYGLTAEEESALQIQLLKRKAQEKLYRRVLPMAHAWEACPQSCCAALTRPALRPTFMSIQRFGPCAAFSFGAALSGQQLTTSLQWGLPTSWRNPENSFTFGE